MILKANRGPIGLGLIGVGGWGGANAANIMRSGRFNVLGVNDIQEEAARRFANRFKTKRYEDLEALLAESAIQAVCITVPNPHHSELVKLAADAGKHIFIEKPLASHPDSCGELGRYCEDRGVLLQVGHQTRREPAFREIKALLESGELGCPLYAQGIYTMDRRSRKDWRTDAKACPGGSMEQLGVHLIDVLIYLLGAPLESEGWARNIPTSSDEADWGAVILRFPGNVRAEVCTSFSSPKHMRLEMFLEKGCLVTEGKTIEVKYVDGGSKMLRPRGISGAVSQFQEFADCIKQEKKPETGAKESAIVMAAVHSMLSGEKAPRS